TRAGRSCSDEPASRIVRAATGFEKPHRNDCRQWQGFKLWTEYRSSRLRDQDQFHVPLEFRSDARWSKDDDLGRIAGVCRYALQGLAVRLDKFEIRSHCPRLGNDLVRLAIPVQRKGVSLAA